MLACHEELFPNSTSDRGIIYKELEKLDTNTQIPRLKMGYRVKQNSQLKISNDQEAHENVLNILNY